MSKVIRENDSRIIFNVEFHKKHVEYNILKEITMLEGDHID